MTTAIDFAGERERDADVLDSLLSLGPSTVAELAQHTGRTRQAVSRALWALADRSLVAAAGGRQTGGRYAMAWRATRTCPHCGGSLE